MAVLFVTSEKNEILYGSVPQDYILSDKKQYPIKKVNEIIIISYLRVCDVLLGISYGEKDCFEACKLLLLFKRYIERKLSQEVTCAAIKDNYAKLFATFNYYDLYDIADSGDSPSIAQQNGTCPSGNSLYLDSIECYSMLLDTGGKTLGGTIFGAIFGTGNIRGLRIKMSVTDPAKIKTNFPTEFDGNEMSLSVNRIKGSATLVNYLIPFTQPVIWCAVDRRGVTLRSAEGVSFDTVCIAIPTRAPVYGHDFRVSSGQAAYDASAEAIVWTIGNHKTTEEKISIRKMDSIECNRNIVLRFKSRGNLSSNVSVVCYKNKNSKIQCWIRSVFQSGHYEVAHKRE